MSLILEALRKSEAERRRGQAPGLHVELPPAYASRAAVLPAWAWWPLGGVLLFAAAWYVRGLLPQHPAVATPASATTTAAAKPPAHLPDPQPRFEPAPASPPEATPAPSAAAQAEAGMARKSPQLPPTPAPIAPDSAAAPAAPAPAPATPAPASPAPSTPANSVLRLSDLSAEERKSLPPLKLSMHMWNPDPARRFVILDGKRIGEGDRIGDAVVAAITTDGVELDWNGRRLQVPIR